jgi:hypothetical protein
MPSQVRRSRDALARLASHGADTAQIGSALHETFSTAQQALAPIVGARGVAALYQRALHLAGKAHPALAALPAGAAATMDLPTLETALSSLDASLAAAAGDELVHAFREVLASLIGVPLTEHLLGTVAVDPPHDAAAQDD